MKKIWIDLTELKQRPCLDDALRLCNKLGIELDGWYRGPNELSDEACAELCQFEADHTDTAEETDGTWRPFICIITHEMSDEEWERVRVMSIKTGHINGRDSYSDAWAVA